MKNRFKFERMTWLPLWQYADRDNYKYCEMHGKRQVEATILIIANRKNQKMFMFAVCEVCWREFDRHMQFLNGTCDALGGSHSWRLPIEKFIKEEKADEQK